ncbi:MAG: stalk domain-containing protein [Bacillota bacterium]
MKKRMLLPAALLLVCAIFLAMPGIAGGEQHVRVFVNKKLVNFPDIKPIISEGRTMVPVRFVSNELGASVGWDEATKTVTMRQGEKTIVLVIGDTFAHVNGRRVEFDTAAALLDGRTMVPLRFISETFGALVEWVGATKAVYITTETADLPPLTMVTLTLYFSDDQAQSLVKETRVVELTKPLSELVFDELRAGPQRADLRPTIPEGTRLLSLIMFQDIAQINLSSHFRNNHRGGSAGEQMTLYSIVNSLAELSEVNRVLFLLENMPQEAILGHVNTAQPLAPRPELVKN